MPALKRIARPARAVLQPRRPPRSLHRVLSECDRLVLPNVLEEISVQLRRSVDRRGGLHNRVGSSPPSVSAGFVFQLTRISRRGHGPLSSFSSCGSLVSTDPNRSSTASTPRHHHLLRGGLVSVALPRLSPCTSGCRTPSVREGTSSGVPRDPLSHSVCAAAYRRCFLYLTGSVVSGPG